MVAPKKAPKKTVAATEGPKANNIRKMRERSRLTQEELSVLTGLDPTTISKHENMSRGVDEEALRRYARVFKCSSYELFVPPEIDDAYDGRNWSLYVPGSPTGS